MRLREETTLKSKTYEEFVEKFKPKKTTDDCFTPPEIYETVKEWVCKEYGVAESSIVRPFWPGADFTKCEYLEGCVVLDNPPFSILSKICEYYVSHGIKFFLFAPSLTCLSGKRTATEINHLICDANIVYENGAEVRTSFVTNLGDGETVLQTAPNLSRLINETSDRLKKQKTVQLPKYDYPDNIVTAALLQRYCRYGVEFEVKKGECVRVSSLDAQKIAGKGIFGGGLLISSRAAAERAAAERAAAERAAAERAAAHRWELSEREKEIVRILDSQAKRSEE